MQLYLNQTSPYARMVRIVMLEKGLEDEVKLCWCDPWANEAELLKLNPTGRIPVLVSLEKIAISESTLIAFYLNGVSLEQDLLTAKHTSAILHLLGLGQGLMDSAFNQVIAIKYLDQTANQSILSQRRQAALERSLQALNDTIVEYQALPFNMGFISLGVALDYIDFRLPEVELATRFSKLEQWRADIIKRTSFSSSAFN